MKVYVASSWRNEYQQSVVATLRGAGHEVYDFKNPPGRTGFGWSSIDPNWKNWTVDEYRAALTTELAADGFNSDFQGMETADACVLVLPCGRSAHIEAGWFTGKGRPLHVLVPDDAGEAELMYLLAGDPRNHLHSSMDDLLKALAA